MVCVSYTQIPLVCGVQTIPLKEEFFQRTFLGYFLLIVPRTFTDNLVTAILSTGIPLVFAFL